VRRPLKPDSDFIHELLDYFEAAGFEGAPRFLGIDSKNRETLTYIPGLTLPHNGFRLSEDGVRAGARLLRTVPTVPNWDIGLKRACGCRRSGDRRSRDDHRAR
jgi:hypothetical protein